MPADLIGRIRDALLRCGPLDSNQQMRAALAHPSLRHWRHEIPDGDSPLQRANQLIDFLAQRNAGADSGLALFLRTLAGSHEDDCHPELLDLADETAGMAANQPLAELLDAGASPALALLAQLPAGDDVPIPGVAPLPAGSRLPLAPNPHFLGRDQQLRQVAAQMQSDQLAASNYSPVLLTGLGGMGKSQLAAEFAHRYGRYFAGGVYWINCADPANIEAELALCAGVEGMDLPGIDRLDLPAQAARVLREWRHATPRLLIFDNCEEESLLVKWRPSSGGCRLLITSRRQEWDPGLALTTIRLDSLPPAAGQSLIQRLAPHVTDDDAGAIALALGHMPLALHLAGSFLGSYPHFPVAGYLQQLDTADPISHPSLTGEGSAVSPTGHARSVAATFALSWRQLDPADPGDASAQTLLGQLSLLAAGEPAPAWLLADLLRHAGMLPGDEFMDQLTVERAIRRAVNLGLLQRVPTGVAMHRLLADFVDQQRAGGDSPAVEAALLANLSQEEIDRQPLASLPWQAHLLATVSRALDREDEQAARLANWTGYLLHAQGDLAGATFYYRRALAIRMELLGEDSALTAESLNNMGYLLQDQGDLAAARPYQERALAIRRRVLGEDHPNTADSLNNLGMLLIAQGELAAAVPYCEQALAIRRQALGAEHALTALSLNNIGYLLQMQGDLAAAKPYFEEALAIYRQALGEDHPETALTLANLGVLLEAQGDLDGARPYYEQALAVRREVLGEEHPMTALSLNNLGYLLLVQGELAEAKPYFQQALAIRRRVLGENHPDTGDSLGNLAYLLQAEGDLAAAKPYYEQALAIYRRALGDEHPNTGRGLNNVGFLLQAQGDLDGALPYFQEALAIYERALGEQHPTTANSLNNLGHLLYKQGDLAGARSYHERALAIRKQSLGDHHPDTAQSLNNLGALLKAQGDLDGARTYYEHALAIRKDRLGEEHPTTAISLINLGNLLLAQGEHLQGLLMISSGVDIQVRTLGDDHPTTIHSLNNLARLIESMGDSEAISAFRQRAIEAYEASLDQDQDGPLPTGD